MYTHVGKQVNSFLCYYPIDKDLILDKYNLSI